MQRLIAEILPLNRKACNPGLFGKDVAPDSLEYGLRRRVGGELRAIVLIVDIVSNADELTAVVGAGQENDGDAKDFIAGDVCCVGRVSLEDELVDTNGDGTDEQRIELLVVLRAVCGLAASTRA